MEYSLKQEKTDTKIKQTTVSVFVGSFGFEKDFGSQI